MNYERFCDNLLTLDRRILFVGIVDSQQRLMHSSFREGAKLYSDREAIRNFMTRAPYFTINNLEESKPILGGITSVLVRFNKRVFVFSRFDEYVVAVGLDMEVHTPLPDLIEKLVKTAAASSPDSLLSREVTVTSQPA